MTRVADRAYEFGAFRLDPAERLLLRGGQPVALTPKAFDLLVFVVERQGHLVEKQALMAALWPDAVVEEANLAYNVSALRKALGDGQEGEQFIQTVPTRGYRFVAPVREVSAAPAAARMPRRLVGAMLVALALVVLIGGVVVWRLGRSLPPLRPVVRFEIPIPTALRQRDAPALSADGTRLAYIAGGPEGWKLYVRALDSLTAVALPLPKRAWQPLFSPDGGAVAFFTGESLMRIELATGRVTKVCPDTWIPQGATWGTDNRIYFAPRPFSGISVVSADGGEPKELTKLSQPDEVSHGWPELLPGGRHLLFTRWDSDILDDGKIEVLSLASGERRIVMEGGFGARYIPTGHLVYLRSGTLMAVPFDVRTLRVGGTAVKVIEGIAFTTDFGQALFGVSPGGTLAYFAGTVVGDRTRMVWMEVPGKTRQDLDVPPGFYVDPVLSPDGRRLAVAPSYGNHQDIWVADLTRGSWARLTVNPRSSVAPVWRPDEAGSILFSMAGRGSSHVADLFSVPADGSRGPELVYESPYAKFAASSSAAARLVAFTELRPDTRADIWLLDLHGKPAARPFLQTSAWESTPALSPDGVWLAYESDESGRHEIYVRAVSGTGGKWQVSSGGGDRPRWSRDGREIVYRSGKRMMGARVAAGSSLTVDSPQVLFAGEFEQGGHLTPNYDMTPDGRRFLMIEPSHDSEPEPSRLVVIDNWFAELRQKVGR